MDRPNLEPKPSRFQWHALTVLFLIVISLLLHPVAVIGGLLLHWYGRRREYARGFIQGAIIPSLGFYIWYLVYGPGGFIHQPDQSFLQAIPLSPLVAGLLAPFGKLRHFLKPRSLDEMLVEEIQGLEQASERQLQLARRRVLYLPEAKPGDLRLGNVLEWDNYPAGSGINRRGDFITMDDKLLDEHLLIIGATGSGKTVLLTRLVFEIALTTKRGIYLVDGKGQDDLAQEVRAMCYHFGQGNTPIVRLVGQGTGGAAYNGFVGQANAICNRLIQMVRAPEAEGNAVWFADTNRDILQLVCLAEQEGPPRSLAEVRRRLDRAWLKKAWEKHPHELEVIKRISKDDFESLSRRLRVLERPLRQVINEAGFALEDVKSAVFSIRTQSLSDVATSFLRLLLEDFKDMTSELRWPAEQKGTLIIDEFGTFQNENIIQLLQLARSAGLGVILATQDVSTLGSDIIQRRIMSNCNTHILLRSMYPEKVVELAGTAYGIESSVQYLEGVGTGLGSSRVQHQFRVQPDTVRSLSEGEAFVIRKNKAARMLVAQVPDAELKEMVDKLPPEHQSMLTPVTPPSPSQPLKKVEL